MQQTSIQLESNVKKQNSIDVRATLQRKLKSINNWLDAKSEFYSRIAEFSVTRRTVIRINAVSICIIIGGSAIEQHPITSLISALCAAYLVYRLNKKGGKS